MVLSYSHRRRVKLDELRKKSFQELIQIAATQKILVQSNLSKWELITQILRSAYNAGAQLSVEGVLQIEPLGYGMIKDVSNDPALPSHVYVAPSQIQTLGLSDGEKLLVSLRPPNEEESYFAMKELIRA